MQHLPGTHNEIEALMNRDVRIIRKLAIAAIVLGVGQIVLAMVLLIGKLWH